MIEYYQTIPELNIRGRMNTPDEFKRIGLPKDLTGKRVLDIGSNMGAFCIEAFNRGATKIHGVEINDDWRIIADGILDQLEKENGTTYPITYLNDMEKVPQSDLVLLLSVTHVVSDGQKILEQAWKKTKGMMILEINTRLQVEKLKIPKEFKFYGKNKDNRSVYHGAKSN